MKKLTTAKKDQLLETRKSDLQALRQKEDMKGHGKYLGMDVFSWPNPHFDRLSTMIASFPFPVLWVGKHEQIRCTVTYYPETREKIEAAIIHDTGALSFKEEIITELNQVIAAGSLEDALRIVENWNFEGKRVLLFSTDGEKTGFEMELFEDMIK